MQTVTLTKDEYARQMARHAKEFARMVEDRIFRAEDGWEGIRELVKRIDAQTGSTIGNLTR